MFTDPITLTVDTVEKTLPRISLKDSGSVYRTPDGKITFSVSHQNTKGRQRSLVRLDVIRFVTLTSTGNDIAQKFSCYLVVDQPSLAAYNFEPVETSLVQCTDMLTFLTSTGNAALTKVLGLEI